MYLILLANVAATLLMTGVIWMVQVVHYPLFALVGREQFPAYEYAHSASITLLVMPLMLVELGTAFVLALSPTPGLDRLTPWIGLVLAAATWGVTLFFSIPAHNTLSGGFDAAAHAALVSSNWLRTLAWTAHSGLVIYWLGRLLG
ncbi:MAG: hypothetical protein J0M33_08735 [Anaerolineae bacterium]|nr:hypothetical protein [Anaerolineae bacterium]